MDLNYLYQRHCVSLQMAEQAACDCSRMVHQRLTEGYAVLIEDAKVNGTPALAR